MKIRNVVIIGVLVLAFLAMPVFADETPAVAAAGDVQGITPATAFTTYIYTMNHGTNCHAQMPDGDVLKDGERHGSYQWFLLKPVTGVYNYMDIECPLPTFASFSGKHPVIRYGIIQYATSGGDTSKITNLQFFSGKDSLRSMATSLYSVGTPGTYPFKETTIDLGTWYDFQRGLNMVITLRNSDHSESRGIWIGGYGFKGEWS